MVPINLEFEFGEYRAAGTAEQLDQLADTGGFMRYQVVTGERRSIICVNIEEELILPLPPNDAGNYYEATHYPEQRYSFSEEDVFTPEEISVIAAAIIAYNDTRKLKFDQMNFDF